MTRLLPVLGLFLGTLPLAASAQQLAALTDQPLPPGLERAEILEGWQRDDGTRMAGLLIALAPGWKTYWRAPGDAGIPPQIAFAGSENLGKAKLHWPAPEVFDTAGIRTVGYHGGLILPIEITPEDTAKTVDLRIEATIGICDKICIPANLHFEADLTGKGAPDPRIETALAAEPKRIVAPTECTVQPVRDGMNVTARITLPPAIGPEQPLFELASTPVWVSEAQSHREGDQLVATADFVPPEAEPFDLDPKDIRITVLSDRGAVQIDGCTR